MHNFFDESQSVAVDANQPDTVLVMFSKAGFQDDCGLLKASPGLNHVVALLEIGAKPLQSNSSS